MSISTYFRPNIHQNDLEILGVKKQENFNFVLAMGYHGAVFVKKHPCPLGVNP
jgi:hypothetical protein